MVEKLDPAFNRCQYCGEVFFAGAGKNTAKGFICALCVSRGASALNAR